MNEGLKRRDTQKGRIEKYREKKVEFKQTAEGKKL